MSNRYLVAIDDGYAQTKLYGAPLTEGGEAVKLSMRSSVRPGRYGLGTISGMGSVGAYETEEGDHYTVSKDIEAEDTRFDGFHTSPMNRVLVQHALVSAGYGGKELDIITGLPVADFFFEGEKDHDKIEAKTLNLMKKVKLTSSSDPVGKVGSVRVGCQAVAAWVDHVLDDNLEEVQDMAGATAIVDIGGRTTDVAVVVGGSSIDHSKSGTENIGVLDVYEAVGRSIRQRFRTRDKFPLAEMDRAVRTRSIRLWNQEHDIEEIVKQTVREFEGKIAREVERRLGSGSMLSSIVFVGGGGALFKTIANHFPNGVMAEDPEFANARGLYKYARYTGEEG